MIVICVYLILIISIIVTITKIKKHKKSIKLLCAVQVAIMIAFTVYMCIGGGVFIKSLPKEVFNDDNIYIIPENMKIDLNNNEKNMGRTFNGNSFKLLYKDLYLAKGQYEDKPFEKNDAYFALYCYEFTDTVKAENVFNDLLFSHEQHSIAYGLYFPSFMNLIIKDYDENGKNDAYNFNCPSVFVKNLSDEKSIITSYSLSEKYSFMNNPLLAGLSGESYNSVCAIREENYILVILEHTNQKTSYIFDMLKKIGDSSKTQGTVLCVD